MRRFCRPLTLSLIAVAMASQMADAAIIYWPEGRWPKTWGPELEALRSRSRTGDFWGGAGDESVLLHEIPLESREEFERIWPVLVKLKSPGTSLGLFSLDKPATDPNDRTVRVTQPQVLIRVTTQDTFSPEDLEVVKSDQPGWVKFVPKQQRTVELFLYVDGQVIDLNRIRFPKDTPIDDHRSGVAEVE